jgi:hypothetical protein
MKIEYVKAVSVERKQQDGEYQVDLDAPYQNLCSRRSVRKNVLCQSLRLANHSTKRL